MSKTKKKNNKKKVLVLAAILLMAIGFAAISTTLYINGTVNISAGDLDDYIFTNAELVYTANGVAGTTQTATLVHGTTNTVTNATNVSITADGKRIDFSSPTALSLINDQVTLNYTVTNYTQYKVAATVECNEVKAIPTANQAAEKVAAANEFLTVSKVDPSKTLAAYDKVTAESDNGSFSTKLNKSYAEDTPVTFYYQCVLTGEAQN